MDWIGPLPGDLDYHEIEWMGDMPIPPERWPYGPPDFHEGACGLHAGGRFCDCKASDASDTEWGYCG